MVLLKEPIILVCAICFFLNVSANKQKSNSSGVAEIVRKANVVYDSAGIQTNYMRLPGYNQPVYLTK